MVVMLPIVLFVVIALVDLTVLIKLYRVLTMLRVLPEKDTDGDSPSVSVCIAARDETHAMTQCLERVIASDYQKLEILVLDDQSHDDTSILIKSFAHAGVRFIEGQALPEGWLGKNHAQAVLARQASGELILFLDVDTLIEPHTIQRLVHYYTHHAATMVSVLPIRNDHWVVSNLFATMRHFWTLMRFRIAQPRAVANAWLINRKEVLKQLETDDSLPLSVQMETTIARTIARHKKYRLITSNEWLGIRYEKRWLSQVETSIRLLYPQADHNSVKVAGLVGLLLIVLTPYVVVWFYPWFMGIIVAHYLIAYYYLSQVWVRYRLIGALLLPVTIVQEVVLLIMSTWKYNFGTITWKGRPVRKK
jgi:glycosyltransferase involved in cell wall biosynthesis|tara:strand:+ start:2414 stop:3499 length:1086 start_codon:yes stop_codon:yes gene_type:complete